MHSIATRPDRQEALDKPFLTMAGTPNVQTADEVEVKDTAGDFRRLSVAVGGFGGREERRRAW